MALTLANRPRLIEPGLPKFEPGTERYRVAGGGALVVGLSVGDCLALIDPEGGQRAEVAAFSPAGQEDAGALGLSVSGGAGGGQPAAGGGARRGPGRGPRLAGAGG